MPSAEAFVEGSPFEVVGIAASAGGLKALIAVLSSLPSDFPAGIAVVQHLDPVTGA